MNRESGHVHAGSRRRVGADTSCRATRRAFLIALGMSALAMPLCVISPMTLAGEAHGADPGFPAVPKSQSPWTIGVVHLGHQTEAPVVIGLRQGLKDLGYVEGRDVVLEIRAGRGQYSTALEATRELVKAQVRIFVSAGTIATQAVKEAAGNLPVVFTQVGEPISAGFVKSMRQPGGNLTGFSHLLPETTGKRLELLKELVPTCRTVLVIFDPKNPTSEKAVAVARDSAKRLGMRLRERHIRNSDEVVKALEALDHKTTDAILVVPDSLVVNSGEQIIEESRRKNLPVMFHEVTWVDRGGLASYGPSFVDLGRQAARYLDKIRKGANPGQLPVEQPTKFELVVNLKTAKALGIKVPQAILVQADRVIE